MPPTIEYCCSNAAADLLTDPERIDGRPVGRRCLEHCGICRRKPFLVVGGELVREPSVETDSGGELSSQSE